MYKSYKQSTNKKLKTKTNYNLPRAVVCVENPQDFLPHLTDYSIMVINPNSTPSRINYLLKKADWSLLITKDGEQYRNGNKYANEKLFWYTSGTTGDSKFCSFSQQQLDIMAAKICRTYDITSNDRYVSVMGLWHAHGQGFYWATQLAGCATTFMSINNIRNMPAHNPTFITAVPDVLKIISRFNFSNLRFIRSASAPLSNKLYHELQDKFYIPIIEAFGMTEALSHCFTNPLHGEQRIGTVGLPDGIEANIVDGHLHIKGPTLFTDDWFDTGDLAQQDSAGYYRILGRSCDRINVKGIKIDPTSLETQLVESVPDVKECVVFGKDRVNCVYVGDCKPDTVSDFLVGLGSYCRPALVQSVGSIPVSGSGKISRKHLSSYYKDSL
jgi:acyl-coenzyme A synthetase/AMP-(fatty) acid ligase